MSHHTGVPGLIAEWNCDGVKMSTYCLAVRRGSLHITVATSILGVSVAQTFVPALRVTTNPEEPISLSLANLSRPKAIRITKGDLLSDVRPGITYPVVSWAVDQPVVRGDSGIMTQVPHDSWEPDS